jgi:hypothetical protein
MPPETKEKTKLLWVKVPQPCAKKLGDTAAAIGVSRADFMRLILINFINNESTSFTISTPKQ